MIDRFVIVATLGRGGMGVVYRALDPTLNRQVAIKLVATELSHDPAFRARFQAESKAAAAVDHENVLPVYEAGEDHGELFLVTKLVEGTDLQSILQRRQRLGDEETARTVASIAAGLDAAHEAGLVHRDVKPANILVQSGPGQEDRFYLTDFGLAKQVDSGPGQTRPGAIIGTPDYLAPEQIVDGRVDGRVDVYALACLAFKCVTGRAPFSRNSATATLFAHVQDPIPAASELVPGLTSEFDEVLAGGLAKDREHRFASCGALARALGDVTGTGTGTLPSNPRVATLAFPRTPDPPAPVGPAPVDPANPRHGLRVAIVATVLVALVTGGLAAAGLIGDRGRARIDPTDVARVTTPARSIARNLDVLIDRLQSQGGRFEVAGQRRQLPRLRREIESLRRASAPIASELPPEVEPAVDSLARIASQYEGALREGALRPEFVAAEISDLETRLDDVRATLRSAADDVGSR